MAFGIQEALFNSTIMAWKGCTGDDVRVDVPCCLDGNWERVRVCERMRELKDVVRNRPFFASFLLAYYANDDKRISRPLSLVDRSVTCLCFELATKEELDLE